MLHTLDTTSKPATTTTGIDATKLKLKLKNAPNAANTSKTTTAPKITVAPKVKAVPKTTVPVKLCRHIGPQQNPYSGRA